MHLLLSILGSISVPDVGTIGSEVWCGQLAVSCGWR